jgi:hypothetical protein
MESDTEYIVLYVTHARQDGGRIAPRAHGAVTRRNGKLDRVLATGLRTSLGGPRSRLRPDEVCTWLSDWFRDTSENVSSTGVAALPFSPSGGRMSQGPGYTDPSRSGLP